MRDRSVDPVRIAIEGTRVHLEVGHDWPTVLHDALERPGGLRPHFQPIVDLQRGVVAGYEALARFPGLVGVTPDRVLAAAERYGVGPRLEERIVRQVLTARRHLGRNRFLSVNVSPRALLDPGVAAAFAAPDDLAAVIVEVTEQNDVPEAALLAALTDLRARGALIAVDDAGSGYGSLRRIAAIKPQFVKIDRDLVADLDGDPVKAAVVETLGDLAGRIGASVIAEGIERVEEIDALVRMRVPLGQGYAFGRPGPGLAGDVDAALATRGRDRPRPRPPEGSVAAHVEVAHAVPRDDAPAALAALFARRPAPDVAVVVDAAHRPVRLVRQDDDRRGGPTPRPVLCVAAAEGAAAVARRAMTRPLRERFDPLVCWDETGRVVGLVRLERVIEALAV